MYELICFCINLEKIITLLSQTFAMSSIFAIFGGMATDDIHILYPCTHKKKQVIIIHKSTTNRTADKFEFHHIIWMPSSIQMLGH